MMDESKEHKESHFKFLYDAFIAGYMLSGEGSNAEYPFDFDEEGIRECFRDDFEDFLKNEGLIND